MILLVQHSKFATSPPLQAGLSWRRVATLFIALTGLATHAEVSRAEIWQQAMSARASTEYETNPAMSSVRQQGVWREILAPSYTLAGTFGADELNAGASVHVERSSNKALRQDREDPRVSLNWNHTGETSEFGIDARYNEVATRSYEYDGLGVVLTDGTRTTRNVSASWKKSLNERSTLDVNEGYTKTTFKGGTFTDFSSQTGGVMYSYVWSENLSPFVRASYDEYSSADSSHRRRYSAMLGANWKSSEQMGGSVQAGQSRGDGTGSSNSSQGAMTMQYSGQQTVVSLSANRLVVVSGLGGFATTKRVNGSLRYELDERDRAGLDLGWTRSYLVAESTNRILTIWLQRDLNAYFGARMSVLRRSSGGDGIHGASSNVVGLSFSYANPNF